MQLCEIFQTFNDMQMLSERIARFAVYSKVTGGSKIVRVIFCYGERVRMYEFVMKRLKVTETLMGVVFVRRNKVGWMLPARFAGDTVRSDYSRTFGVVEHSSRLMIDNSNLRN